MTEISIISATGQITEISNNKHGTRRNSLGFPLISVVRLWKKAIKIECGTDAGHMCKSLREVPERLASQQ